MIYVATPPRFVVAWALALWLVTRLLDVLLTILFLPGTAAHRLGLWYFWDASWYVGIAQRGYMSADPRLAAFFPLYPLLVHLVAPSAAHAAVFVPALVVSQLALSGALVAVGMLAAHEGQSPELAMLLLAVSPLAVFLGGMYNDGMFVALAAWALLAARRGAWTWAAIAVALAVVARPFGLALVPALLVEGICQRAYWRRLIPLVAAPAATLAAFLLVLWRQYGDPLATIHIEARAFGHAFRWPWQTVALVAQQLVAVHPHWSYPTAHMLLDLLPVLACLSILIIGARCWPVSFTLYTALGLLLILTSPVVLIARQYALVSAGRYCYALVPALHQLGAWAQRLPRWCVVPLLGASLVLQSVLTVFVLRGGWLV